MEDRIDNWNENVLEYIVDKYDMIVQKNGRIVSVVSPCSYELVCKYENLMVYGYINDTKLSLNIPTDIVNTILSFYSG